MSTLLEQLLLPATALEPRHEQLDLDRLPPDDALPSDPPDKDFVASIRRVRRVLQPIVVFEHADGALEVVCGRRRVKGARAAGLHTVPADIYPAGWIAPELLTVIENTQRSTNQVAEYEAIARLLEQGADESQICAACGLTPVELRARYRLHTLAPALWVALKGGAIRARVALKAARLPAEGQERLIAQLGARGRLSAADVRAARHTPRAEAIAALPEALFATPSAATAARWQEAVAHLLLQARALLPAGEDALRLHLDAGLSLLHAAGDAREEVCA